MKSFLFDLLEENKKLKKQVSSLNKEFEDLKGSCERDREDVWKIVSELCDKLNKLDD